MIRNQGNEANSQGLKEIDLLPLDKEAPTPPKERLANAQAAQAIYLNLRRANETSTISNTRIDAMFDGFPPYDNAVLRSTGQGARTNLNFGEAQRYLDVSMSAFVDLYSSLESLVSVKLGAGAGEPQMRGEMEAIVGEELTASLRDWPEFHSYYLRLCSDFTKHGVSVSYFESAQDWRFRVCGFNEFLIPRQTQATEEAIEVSCARRQYLLHELYAFVKDEEIATKLGWNVAEMRRVIQHNATTNGSRTSNYTDWEATQRELKNNDLHVGTENTSVAVIHMWVREFDGRISHYMFAEESPKEFLFKKPAMFERSEQAFVLFTFGVGSNGTYHSIRGLGQRIFNHVQTSNRLRCQVIDSAMMAGSVMIQPDSERALNELSYTLYGAYSILSPNVRVIEKASPNLSQNMMPALASIENQMSLNVDLTSTYGTRSSPYRNELQTEHDLAVSSRLTGSTLNLFYNSWGRLLREVVRRFVSSDTRKDPTVVDFFARCAARGVPAEAVKSLLPNKTTAIRAIGSGSHADRLLALRELKAESGGYDEVGRRNLLRDITATRIGYDLVDRYAPSNPAPRLTVDAKISVLENESLQAGRPVAVLDGEFHGMHISGHSPLLQQYLSGVDTGEVDPMQALPIIKALAEHITAHLNFLVQDPNAKPQVAETKQLLQIAEEIVANFTKKLMKQQRDSAQSGQAPEGEAQAQEGQPQQPSAMELRMQEHQLKMDIARQKAELDMRIKQAKSDQDAALRDAEQALSFGKRK